jgi:Ca2+-binding RTX toxin-like protein
MLPIRIPVAAGLLAIGLTASADAAPAAQPVTLSRRTLTVKGSAADDSLALRLQAGKPNKLEIDLGDDGSAEFRVSRNRFDRIRVRAGRGDDRVRIDDSNGPFTDTTPTTLDGQRGNDTLLGGRGAERLLGGRGSDTEDGNQGNDTALLGAGDDRFIWDPGDGSDTLEGQSGTDEMRFNGANINEIFDVSANGGRVRFTRNVGKIVMDLNDVERVDTRALGGSDLLTINDLSGTDLTQAITDLAGTPGGTTEDGAADRIVVNATSGDDVIAAAGTNGSATVSGLAPRVDVTHANAQQDELVVNALAGDDVVEASGLAANAIKLVADGGNGDDVLVGGSGPDTLSGAAGDDVLLGGPGQDTLDGGPGDNIVIQD